MSSRVGPIVIALISAAVRISGDHGAADVLALAALATLTLALHRADDLRVVRVAACAETSRDPRSI